MAAGAGALLAGPLLAACDDEGEQSSASSSASASSGGGGTATGGGGAGGGGGGQVVFLSTQLAPAAEAATVRNQILPGYSGSASFVPTDETGFLTRVRAQAQTGSGSISLLGALHGSMSTLRAEDALMDLSDRFSEIEQRGYIENYLQLARFDGQGLFYIPWLQATYLMAARRDAVEHLPSGADVNALTYEQLTAWAQRLVEVNGERVVGFPAGGNGLFHRFLQGYLLPSFTGALNTEFASDEAVAAWDWLARTWDSVHAESVLYGFMQEPLRLGEVQVAWDHTARLKEALQATPEEYVVFPSPTGPEGLGFMPVVAGLGIPKSASNPDGAWELIKHLTSQQALATTLQETGFLPPLSQELDVNLDPGLAKLTGGVARQTSSNNAVLSLLPTGLGSFEGLYTKVFYDIFRRTVLEKGDIRAALDVEAGQLQAVLQQAGASCWQPDPTGQGVCQVS